MPQHSAALVQELVRQHYPSLGADLLEPLLHFTTVARHVLGGDSDKVLIMMVVAVRTMQHPDFAELTPEELQRGKMLVLPSLGVNIRSIAESTGIPRETVRRKAAELVTAGFLVRQGADLRMTAEGYEAAAPAREALERMVARTYMVVCQKVDACAGVDRLEAERAVNDGARRSAQPDRS